MLTITQYIVAVYNKRESGKNSSQRVNELCLSDKQSRIHRASLNRLQKKKKKKRKVSKLKVVNKIENFQNFRSSLSQSFNLFLSRLFSRDSYSSLSLSLSFSLVLTEVSTDSLPGTNYCRTPRAGCKSSKEPGLTKRGEKKEGARRKHDERKGVEETKASEEATPRYVPACPLACDAIQNAVDASGQSR